ncbi:HTTM domain-containing protein [Streptomyces coeruleorubidus]|uniref:HTTM domain-containing protein n=1 Tax=Streptomyces coeruleorubidus TaxID=116188 RepID=UPI00237FB25D|nr:HTTM domain-containing protein [Streptomyces coeruleorubidus]WDV53335.1 HTTM domain-containing protein [Streptomyces coeruleorubidus]
MKKIDSAASRPVAALGVSGTRALLGFVGLMYYLSHYGDRSYLFGPGADSVLPHRLFVEQIQEKGSFSLYAWSTSDVWFEAIFHLGVLAALAVTVGVGGRVVLAAHGILLWSLYERQSAFLDGGDNLAQLVIPMLLLTNCYQNFSFSSGVADRVIGRLPGSVRSLGVPLHNLGVVAIAVQMCLVYVVSGLYKVQGEVWQDGTALFYIMRVPEFELPGLSNLVYNNDVLVFLGTYSTTLFLVYFPMGILVPSLRPWTAVASIAFHASIGVFMGLTAFALTMIACDLIFLSSALSRARRMARKISKSWTQKQPESIPAVTDQSAPESDTPANAPVPQAAR